MNLIGHFTCAAVPSPPVRAGAVLPDLVALYRRAVRPRALLRAWEQDAAAPDLAGLRAGVVFHHAVDARFHQSPLFRFCADGIQAALLGASREPGLKRFLPAHVLCELYLDHLLLRRDPGLAAALYRDLAGSLELMTTFVARHPAADAASFRGFVERFVASGFLAAYGSHAGVLGRMNRILPRFGQRRLGAAEQAAVAAWFRDAAGETERRLAPFLQEMHRLAPQEALGPSAADWRAAAAQQWAAGRLSLQFA